MRTRFLPFSRPSLGKEEIDEVVDSLKSGWLTTGPKVQRFESDFAQYVHSPYSIAVNSATSGLHLAYLASSLRPGDEVITTPLTFISTVSMLFAVGARVKLVDIDPKTLNIDSSKIESKISSKTKAIVPVHFAGLACDMDKIHAIAIKHRLKVIEDAAHAVGSEYKGKKIGSLSDCTVFSFHPIKNMTTGEGGMMTTPHKKWAEKMTLQRFHGMSKLAWKRYSQSGSPHYDIGCLGYKYNMMDIQAALGIHQLKKLEGFIDSRTKYANLYQQYLSPYPELILPQKPSYEHKHAWHLYVVMVNTRNLKIDRDRFIQKCSEQNIGTGIHFTAVHQHSFYRKFFKDQNSELTNANFVSERILSLPLYPSMKEQEVMEVIKTVQKIIKNNSKRIWN